MNTDRPILCRWDGENLTPANLYWATLADKQFVIGEQYAMTPYEDRTDASHRHQFAFIREAWLQMPERLTELYPSPTHLRKRALIEAGYYDETIVDAGTNAAALRVASAFRAREEFAHVVVRGPLVAIRSAKSQSRRAMNRETFQASKTAIMDVVAQMIGVQPEDLGREAGRAA